MSTELTKYHTKLRGVSFEGRQEVIAKMDHTYELRLRREPNNQYDADAVAVDSRPSDADDLWRPIGYIAQDKNSDLARELDKGREISITLSSLTGGEDDRSRGVIVFIEYGEEVAPEPAKQNPLELLSALLEETAKQDLSINITANKNNTVRYTSKIIGKSIDLQEVYGHKRLEGYMSGSKFPGQFFSEFDKDRVLEAMAEKYDVLPDSIEGMWSLSGEASTGFGDGVHAAMELYDKYYKLGDKTRSVKKFKTKPDEVGPNRALSKNPFLKKVVEDFHSEFGGDYVRFTEEFIWTESAKLCGSIDRLKIVDADKRIVRIQDYKTDGDIHKKKYQKKDSPFKKVIPNTSLGYHQLQLSFYAHILTAYYGYTVEGLDVYWLNPSKLVKGDNAWEEYKLDVVDIGGVL